MLGILHALVAVAAVVVLLAGAGLAGLLWLTLPPPGQIATIPELSAPVDIRFDADGVPRIHAATALDAAAALGFVHARDRMFQMELMRRAASGRLSELAGPATLRLDRTMRTLGLRVRAVEDLAALPPATRAVLDAYTRGVNAWIALRQRLSAPEFMALGAPEPWTPVDSLLWGKTMALWLSGNWREEIERLALAHDLPQARLDELWQSRGPAVPLPDAEATPVGALARRLAAWLPRFPAPFTLPDTASNEWAVDGRHSASGAPLLAGDPHLAFGAPGIWYLARIDTPEGVLAGATAPGVPFLVIGHNGHIAWTFTTTGADTQDVFIETPTSEGAYQTPDGPRLYTLREERIRVRGHPDEVLQVRETRHGPVVSDLLGDLHPKTGDGAGAPPPPVLAVAMANLAPGDTASAGLLALNQARDVAEAARAAALITAPSQNLLVADRQHIALYVTGRVPIRRAGDGAAPVDGADGAHDWTGFADPGQLPRYIDPPSGRLINANERIAPADFPLFLGRDWFAAWRANRIRALLGQSDQHTIADFAAMQTDVESDFAHAILPTLRAVHPPAGLATSALALLADWDGGMAMDRPQPLIFNAWVGRFYDDVLRQAGVTRAVPGAREDFVAFVLSPAGAAWCHENCGGVLASALDTAMTDLAARYGGDPAAWRWGPVHRAVFANPVLAALPLLGPLTTALIDSPGDDTTVDRGGTAADFTSVHGASYRGVYDLADLDRSLFIVTPGQSGNPVSQHARDFLTRWRDGGTVMLMPDPQSVSATLRLVP